MFSYPTRKTPPIAEVAGVRGLAQGSKVRRREFTHNLVRYAKTSLNRVKGEMPGNKRWIVGKFASFTSFTLG